jgi:hypothetical protein
VLIKSLEQMEKVVAGDRTLSWDGWDVVQSFPSPGGWSKQNGAFIKGKWYTQRRFTLSSKGWDIPHKLVR